MRSLGSFYRQRALASASKTGEKTGESNPITDPWDWYIYLHFFVDFYGKCREIYQSHGWYGNVTDAIKNPLGERTAVAGKISINLYPLKNPKNPVLST